MYPAKFTCLADQSADHMSSVSMELTTLVSSKCTAQHFAQTTVTATIPHEHYLTSHNARTVAYNMGHWDVLYDGMYMYTLSSEPLYEGMQHTE